MLAGIAAIVDEALAVGAGGAFGRRILVSATRRGELWAVGEGGRAEKLAGGLDSPRNLRIDPTTGDLWLVAGPQARELLRLRAR